MNCLRLSSLISDKPDTRFTISMKTSEANIHSNRMTAQFSISGMGKLINCIKLYLPVKIDCLVFIFSVLSLALYFGQKRSLY